MRRTLAVALVATIALQLQVSPLFAAGRPDQGTASISGTTSSSGGRTVPNMRVQLRNLATGQLAGKTVSNEAGQFVFAGLNPGNYAVEVVNAAGRIIGTSGSIAVSAGATVAGITVASAVAAAGAGAAGAGGAAAGLSTAAIVGIIAAGAGVATVVVVKKAGSASK